MSYIWLCNSALIFEQYVRERMDDLELTDEQIERLQAILEANKECGANQFTMRED